jgi:uncharacterized protein (UPF0297 family)
MKKTEYNDKEIWLTKEDWIEIYYALDAKLDELVGYIGNGERCGDPQWIERLEEIQNKIDQGQR